MRRAADLPPAEAVRALIDDQGRIAVRVTAGARVETLEVGPDRLLAKVRARAEDGKANRAVMALVAACLDLPPSRIALLRGATSREKVLLVQ